MTSTLGLFEAARQTQDIKDFQRAFRVFSLAIAANTRCLSILAPGLVQRAIQLLDRENTQFDEDTEEGQMMGAMVRNVVAQDNALSGGGAEAGPSTPRRPGPTFESVTASSFVVSPTDRDQARFRQIRDDEDSDRLTRAQALGDKASDLCQAKAGLVEVVAGEVARPARLAGLAHLDRGASRRVSDDFSLLEAN